MLTGGVVVLTMSEPHGFRRVPLGPDTDTDTVPGPDPVGTKSHDRCLY